MPVTDSKSARKKKAKAEATTATNGSVSGAAVTPQAVSKDESAAAEDVSGEHAYIKELQKQIRNTTKKLSSLAKVDAILSENPGVSLDDLVAQRKINNDQRAAAQKKPQLQAQLVDLEERIEHYRKLDQDYQAKFTKQRDELASQHEQTTAKLRKELSQDAFETAQKLLRQKLLTFSQFLRCAAAKRNAEEAVDDDESRAFEGALLLVYGGDQKAVDTAMNLIDGSNETVPNIDGEPLQFTFAQVKEVSLKYTPFANEETWVDQVADATSGEAPQPPSDSAAATSDPTIVNAGLTELEASTVPNGHVEPTSAPLSGEAAGNVAGERWDADAAGTSAGAQQGSLQESYEIVPRPSEEVEIPAETPAPTQQQGTSWAEESHEAATGNQAGESWHTKAPGEQDNSWGDSAADTLAPTTDADGFSEVPGRTRGRGGFRGRGDDEFRGRGGRRGNFRGRGDGEFRGGRGGGRGRGEGGEFRGRGRGRGGPRGGAAAPAAS
ncbi:uncharacterized protein MYCFIDRAFT_186763 [Pseudocercospora fijiensis CIRAD86]|uniref:YAG7-like dimerisation domain-containing protein n=1 Tax=Pseudocercospora fijiensis (strain CIRAD86) TaxID=383855 RepID=M3APT5_PSEFD|nr:uncharacterized protein MYCFIDRAFT_186763 [Pseudocercospora fijiensis CIRAD86]EME86626.1 hypothetical protein MYCFIDRAFT_186763 [Pseudocercospora fijiensis CIRAD86]